MISERVLRKWRGEALQLNNLVEVIKLHEGANDDIVSSHSEAQKRILKLTQELLDQHLVRKA